MRRVGILYRPDYYREIVAEPPDHLELTAEHFFSRDPRPLSRVAPISVHGLDLSIGSDEPLDVEAAARRVDVCRAAGALYFSEHLCFTKLGDRNIGSLTPLPFTEEAIGIVVPKLVQLQRMLPCPLLIENIAYYFRYEESEMPEEEFLTRVLRQADVGLLLDVHNLHANAVNHGYDPEAFIERLPRERIVEAHVAGGAWKGGRYYDTHAHPVPEEVWRLLRRVSPRLIVLERDSSLPSYRELLKEARHAA